MMYHGDSRPQDQAADAAMTALYRHLDDHDLPGDVPFDTAAGQRDLIGRIRAELSLASRHVVNRLDRVGRGMPGRSPASVPREAAAFAGSRTGADGTAPPRDELSFAEFYRTHRGKMIALVRALTRGRVSDPELVAEDGWVRFYPHWEDCEYPKAYLRRCMITAVHDALDQPRSEPQTYSSDERPALVSTAVAASYGFSEADPGATPWDPELTAALQRLSPKLRDFVLLDTELNRGERSLAEIAQILGITRSAAYARKNRAYATLRRLLPPGYLEAQDAAARLAPHPGST